MTLSLNGLPNFHLVTLAVALLGGEANSVDREDIAIKVNEICPGRFNWRKYPEYIDLDSVGVALRDAKKIKNGELIVGNNINGWMLSPNGMKWIDALDLPTILNSEAERARKESITANQEMERARLRNTNAFHLFKNNFINQISRQDFYQFARINEYFQTKARQRRYAIIDNVVLPDKDLSSLWSTLKRQFSEEMK